MDWTLQNFLCIVSRLTCLNPYASNVSAKYKVHLIRLSQLLFQLNLNRGLSERFPKGCLWIQFYVLIAALRLGTNICLTFISDQQSSDVHSYLQILWMTFTSSQSARVIFSFLLFCLQYFDFFWGFISFNLLKTLSTHTHTQCMTFNLVPHVFPCWSFCFLFLCFFISLQENIILMVWIYEV